MVSNPRTKPTDDSKPLYSQEHIGSFGRIIRDNRTIGEIILADKKPSILFKLLRLFK